MIFFAKIAQNQKPQKMISTFLLLLITSVLSHPSLNPAVSAPSSYFASSIRIRKHTSRFTLLIAHGCNLSDTTSIMVTIPEGITAVKPAVIPGWTITLTRRDLPVPIVTEGIPIYV